MDLENINQGLATAAATVTGLTGKPWLPATISQTPLFCPIDLEFDPHQTFAGGLTQLNYVVAVICSRGDLDTGRLKLQTFLPPAGTTSVLAALETDKTLGGACKTLIVGRWYDINGLIAVGGSEYYSAKADVRVWAS